jgi:hypothetical protein
MSKMRETDVKDKRGNVVISKGLKVRHKKSQFEYTVDSVIKEPSGQITIMLASPETPRFGADKKDNVLTDKHSGKILYETEPMDDMSSMFYVPDDKEESDEDLLAVPAAEFEKEYEIK